MRTIKKNECETQGKAVDRTGNTETLLGILLMSKQFIIPARSLVNTQSVHRQVLVNLMLALKERPNIFRWKHKSTQLSKSTKESFITKVEITGMRLEGSCSLYVATETHSTMEE